MPLCLQLPGRSPSIVSRKSDKPSARIPEFRAPHNCGSFEGVEGSCIESMVFSTWYRICAEYIVHGCFCNLGSFKEGFIRPLGNLRADVIIRTTASWGPCLWVSL